MDRNEAFYRDVEAVLSPNRGMTCGFGSTAHGAQTCKDKNCGVSALHLFSGYCSSCAPRHGIQVLTLTDLAATPDAPAQENGQPTALSSVSAL